METTSVPDAMEGLAALLAQAAATLDPAPASSLGWPAGGLALEQLEVMGRVENWVRTWDTTAPVEGTSPNMEETFTLWLRVRTFHQGKAGEFLTGFSRHMDLVAAVEFAIRNDYTLDGAVHHSTLSGGDFREGIAENGREMVTEWSIACQTSLTG